ncbi:unnamed protein product [Urochloa decumbens]|uniref:F-box domain-containing protein n=1 Tax=Urochloa decumbens TaxID=240449 RepID=A0ABC8Y4T3_9POAL
MDQAEDGQRDVQQQQGLLRMLPDDILDDVLRRLAPRELSVLRCAGKAWRAAVEARGLLLPRAVGGIFVWWNDLDSLEFVARPTAGTPVSGRLADFIAPKPRSRTFRDHCNGLLLFDHCVVNPATRSCAPLPPRLYELTRRDGYFYYHEYLVLDPAVSPHHEVFAIPKILYKPEPGESRHRGDQLDPTIEKSEWPPSSWDLLVFSSRTGQWEERTFLRDGAAAGTVASMRWSSYGHGEGHYAAYWQGELYVHYDGNYFIRIFLSGNKYQVIKPPLRIRSLLRTFHLGRSKKGVYCALTYPLKDSYWLRVWILEESCGRMKWVLKNQTDLKSLLACRKVDEQFGRPWILRDINYYEKRDKDDDDDDDEEEEEEEVEEMEVVFLNESRIRGLAYHFNNSKVQDLGYIRPRNYGGPTAHIKMSFPYTPCWMGEYPVQS